MMKLFYALVLLLVTTQIAHAQILEFSPIQGNPALKSHIAQEDARRAAEVEAMIGRQPELGQFQKNTGDCPPDFDGYLVEAGSKLVIELDTFGLAKDTFTPQLTILANDVLLGSASILANSILLSYEASNLVAGAGIDTVVVGFSQPAGDTSLVVPFYVKRKGRTVIVDTKIVVPETVTNYCFGEDVDFPNPTVCSEFIRCTNPYDGDGQQLFHSSSYAYPDTCVVYYASRFPGTDTVCVMMCDEWAVCDTFKVPFKIVGDTITSLPVFDDFSSYQGPYPSGDLWLDKNVFINNTLAKDPPSVGMASFDGLDRRGDIYEIQEGVGDRLTSRPIDLSGLSPADNVTLRYFVAPKGYGLEPEEDDIFTLEFRNAQREWVTVNTVAGIGDVALDFFPPFQFYGSQLDDPQFFHPAFQFRFSANTSPGGEVDMWHLDYVRLSANAGLDSTFPDVAFTEIPTSILKNYTAMPWRHFVNNVGEEVRDSLESHFFNHFDQTTALQSSEVNIVETTSGSSIGQPFPVVAAGTDNNITAKTPNARIRNIPDLTQKIQDLSAIPDAGLRVLLTEYFYTQESQSEVFRSNDTVRLYNIFSDYFAHDDGTAEWQFYPKFAQGGERMASKFHANVDDTLRAVQLMFPRVNGDVQNQIFTLQIWTDIDSLESGSEPTFERELLKPFYPSNVLDTLQGFTTYVLDNFSGDPTPFFIPKGDFYVGIEQGTATDLGIPVGFDLQNDCKCGYAYISGVWRSFAKDYKVAGSLMIRPVFGQTVSTVNDATEVDPFADIVKIYPNPTSGRLNFSLSTGAYSNYKVLVYNELGQMLEERDLSPEMDLGHLGDGLYFLQILDGKTGAVFIHKVFVAGGRK